MADLSDLINLNTLDVSNNMINGDLDWNYLPQSLTNLNMSSNSIMSNLFENLTDIPQSIQHIDFGQCSFLCDGIFPLFSCFFVFTLK